MSTTNFSEEFKRIISIPAGEIVKYETNKDQQSAFIDQCNLYRSPPGYLNWDAHLRMTFLSGSSTVAANNYAASDAIGVKVGEVTRDVVFNRGPARYLAKEMCEAFAQTPIPSLTKDVLEVLPYVHVMLPRQLVFDHMNDEVFSLVIRTGELYPVMNEEEKKMQKAMINTFFKDENSIPENMIGAHGIQIATMTVAGCNFWQEFVDEDAKSWYEENVKHKDRSGYQNEATERIMRIGINSLLVHLFEPELITTDRAQSVTKGLGFARSAEKQPLPPTWIGKSFRYERQKQHGLNKSSAEKKSIRAHWRTGHWHSYLIGKGRTERIIKWIKPVYVRSEATQ